MLKVATIFLLLAFCNSSLIGQNGAAVSYNTDAPNNVIKYTELASKTKIGSDILAYIDSAEYYYNQNPVDSLLLELYASKYHYRHNEKDYETALVICKEGLSLAKECSLLRKQTDFNKNIAIIFLAQKMNDSAFVYFNKAYIDYDKLIVSSSDTNIHDYRYAGYCSYKKGRILYSKSIFDDAIKEFYIALRYYEVIDYELQILQITNTLGSTYFANGHFDNAYIEYLKTIKMYEKVYPDKEPYKILQNIGAVLLSQEKYDSALVYLNMARVATPLKYKTSLTSAGLLMNIGIIFKRKEMFDSSFVYFNMAYEIYKHNSYLPGIVRTKANIGLGYIENKQYNKAEKELLWVLPNSIEINQALSTVEIYNGLYVINYEKKSYKKALEYYHSYIDLQDSINSVDVTNKINEYKEQFEAEKKDRDIGNLKQLAHIQKIEKEKQQAVNKDQKLIMILLVIIAISLIGTIILINRYYKLKRIASEERYKKAEEDSKQKVVDLVKRYEVNSINSYMEGQEKERGRIASELHDRLGSLLSAVKLHFSSFEDQMNINKESKESYSFALNLLDNSVHEVRTISRNLSKELLTQFGLSGAIENLRDAINLAGKIQVKYINIGSNDSISSSTEIELFRIIQELITNAIKHSKSDKIFIQQINSDDSISITVEDYGVGFDVSKIRKEGMGLDNLRLRANNIGAEYNYESSPGQGTSVTIELNEQV